MKLILIKQEMRYGGVTYHAGDEIEAEEIGEVRAWFALGWVKKADEKTIPSVAIAKPVLQTAQIQAEPMTTEDNVLTPPKRKTYRRRDMKAED